MGRSRGTCRADVSTGLGQGDAAISCVRTVWVPPCGRVADDLIRKAASRVGWTAAEEGTRWVEVACEALVQGFELKFSQRQGPTNTGPPTAHQRKFWAAHMRARCEMVQTIGPSSTELPARSPGTSNRSCALCGRGHRSDGATFVGSRGRARLNSATFSTHSFGLRPEDGPPNLTFVGRARLVAVSTAHVDDPGKDHTDPDLAFRRRVAQREEVPAQRSHEQEHRDGSYDEALYEKHGDYRQGLVRIGCPEVTLPPVWPSI